MSELIKLKKENQFWDSSCIMHNKEKLSEVLNESIKIELILVNLEVNKTYQNDKLKNAKIVIVNWKNSGGWFMQTIHITSGYSLNTYNNKSCGSTYYSETGTIAYTYSSDKENFTISHLCIIK